MGNKNRKILKSGKLHSSISISVHPVSAERLFACC